MRRIGIFLALILAGCEKQGSEADDVAEESGGTETGTAERCEDQVEESACNGLMSTNPDEDAWKCAWVDVWSSTPTCDAGPTESRCVTLEYIGAGCPEAFACGELEGPSLYVGDAGDGSFELFLLEACEYQPDFAQWDHCVWKESGEIHPHPACACGC